MKTTLWKICKLFKCAVPENSHPSTMAGHWNFKGGGGGGSQKSKFFIECMKLNWNIQGKGEFEPVTFQFPASHPNLRKSYIRSATSIGTLSKENDNVNENGT